MKDQPGGMRAKCQNIGGQRGGREGKVNAVNMESEGVEDGGKKQKAKRVDNTQ